MTAPQIVPAGISTARQRHAATPRAVCGSRRKRRGAILVWFVFVIPLMMMILFALTDYGQLSVAGIELKGAADAAALSAAQSWGERGRLSTAVYDANSVFEANPILGRPVSLLEDSGTTSAGARGLPEINPDAEVMLGTLDASDGMFIFSSASLGEISGGPIEFDGLLTRVPPERGAGGPGLRLNVERFVAPDGARLATVILAFIKDPERHSRPAGQDGVVRLRWNPNEEAAIEQQSFDIPAQEIPAWSAAPLGRIPLTDRGNARLGQVRIDVNGQIFEGSLNASGADAARVRITGFLQPPKQVCVRVRRTIQIASLMENWLGASIGPYTITADSFALYDYQRNDARLVHVDDIQAASDTGNP